MKRKLLGSAPDRDGILRVIEDFYLLSVITLVPAGDYFEVHTRKGKTGTIARQAGKRWRFETNY